MRLHSKHITHYAAADTTEQNSNENLYVKRKN